MRSHVPALLAALIAIVFLTCVSCSPLLISEDGQYLTSSRSSAKTNLRERAEAALIQKFSKLYRRSGQEEEPGDLLLIPTVRPHRTRRQSEGISDMLSNLGGRFSSLRDSLRERVRPIGEQLNPLPLVENMGKMLAEASTNTVSRGRDALAGVRDFGSRSVGRLRDGATDAWDSLRDNWEEFWDL